jgi:hypothetical protein
MFWVIPSHHQGDKYKRTGRQKQAGRGRKQRPAGRGRQEGDIQEGMQSGSKREAETGGQLEACTQESR